MWKPVDRRAYDAFRDLALRPEVRVVSADVFDTLLLRTTRPEAQRFEQIGARQLAALARAGYQVRLTRKDLLVLRLLCARFGYRNAAPVEGVREGRYEDILGAMAAALGLPGDALGVLREAELAYEREVLSANDALIEILEAARRAAKRVVTISDMYLSRDEVGGLVRSLARGFEPDAVYVSADFGFGKRSGRLYRSVAALEGVEPSEIAHCGDNALSDVEMARRMGLRAVHVPRPRSWARLHRARQRLFARHRGLAAL